MRQLKGVLLAMISSSTFGLIPLFALPAMQEGVGLDSVLFYRFAISAVVVGAYLLLRRVDLRITLKEFGTMFLLGGAYASTSLFLTASYLYIPSGVATTIHFLYPVLVTAIMIAFFKDKISLSVIIATVLAILGVYLLSSGEGEGVMSWKGLFMVLSTVVTYAIYIVGVNKSCIQHMGGLKMTFYMLFCCTIIFGANILLKGQGLDMMPNANAVVHIFLLSLIPTLVSDLTLILAISARGVNHGRYYGMYGTLDGSKYGSFVFGRTFRVGADTGSCYRAGSRVHRDPIQSSGTFFYETFDPGIYKNKKIKLKIRVMVNLIRITEPTDIRLQKLIPLYKEAFPEEERRNIKQLERLIREKTEMHFNAIETGWCFGRFCLSTGICGFLLP